MLLVRMLSKILPNLFLAAILLTVSCSSPSWTASKEGALLYNQYPKPDETVSWDGSKDSDGFAHGKGTALWSYSGGRNEKWVGEMSHGKATPSMKLERAWISTASGLSDTRSKVPPSVAGAPLSPNRVVTSRSSKIRSGGGGSGRDNFDPLYTDSRAEAGATHWLNFKTGIRHNSGCRYFGKTASGRSCSSTSGTACGVCGG